MVAKSWQKDLNQYIYIADEIYIVLGQIHIEILQLTGTIWQNKIAFWKEIPSRIRVNGQWNYQRNMSNYVVTIKFADSLATLGARSSADTVMTQLVS